MAKYISVADTAKLVRKALKAAFPGVKFGVRSKSYSGGASINVSWVNGPTSDSVDAICREFRGAVFDGMIDLKSYVTHEVDGESVHYGADYIFCTREMTREFISNVERAYESLSDEERCAMLNRMPGAWRIDTDNLGRGLASMVAV